MSKSTSLRHSIMAARDFKIAPVMVPQWGDITVYVRTLSVLEAIACQKECKRVVDAGEDAKFAAALLTFTLCDEEGDPIFRPGDPASIEDLCSKDQDAITLLYNEWDKLANPPAPAKGGETPEGE